VPSVGVITHIKTETPDVKTFRIATNFTHAPGQCAMIGIPSVGEAMFSISSSPTNAEYMEFSIKAVGKLTNHLHKLAPGSQVTIRGAYGKPFPVDDALRGKDLLFIAGGIGLAPLRSVIGYVFDKRENYGTVDILYGARSASDLVFKGEVTDEWQSQPNTNTYVTIDHPQDGWRGHVGFVPAYLQEIGFANDKTALICGPPIMIKYTLAALITMGFKKEQVYTTLEMRMKCGIGKCGRCNIGSKYACKDGSVFRCDELDYLPEEY